MNDRERILIQYVADGDIKNAQKQARIILNGLTTKKDERFKEAVFRKLDVKQNTLIELPYNLRELLSAEDSSAFPEERFLLRPEEKNIVDHITSIYRVAAKLEERGISYSPTLMLHGKSGCGKTMLAKYIAYKLQMPFVYVRFSGLVNSYLGKTQQNIQHVFDYARKNPCVLCFDEIDAVGMQRGQTNDVAEMNRVVIALMQEMDHVPNNVIIIGTTNRFDRLDTALIRRFTRNEELRPMTKEDAEALAKKFFTYAGVVDADFEKGISAWCQKSIKAEEPASSIISKCTRQVVEIVKKSVDTEGGGYGCAASSVAEIPM